MIAKCNKKNISKNNESGGNQYPDKSPLIKPQEFSSLK